MDAFLLSQVIMAVSQPPPPAAEVVFASFPGGCEGGDVAGVEGVRSINDSSGVFAVQSPVGSCCTYGINFNNPYFLTCSDSSQTNGPSNTNFKILACSATVATVQWSEGGYSQNKVGCSSQSTTTVVALNASGFGACVPAIGQVNTSMIVTSLACPGEPPFDAPPGKGFVSVILNSAATKSNRFLELNLPFGQCSNISTGAIRLESCTENSLQFTYCPGSANCSCGMSAIRDAFVYSTHKTSASTIGVELPSNAGNPFGTGGSATVMSLRCPVGAPAPLPQPAFTLVTWTTTTGEECNPQQPPSWVAHLTAPFNRCESIPSHVNSVLNGLYYSITGCAPGSAGNATQIAVLVCGDSKCTQCKSVTYSEGQCQANPFVPFSPSVVAAIQCPNGPGEATSATAVTASVVTYNVSEDDCAFSATPTQFVPMNAPIGACTPFPAGPANSPLTTSFFVFDNCTDDMVSGSLCNTSTCTTECSPLLLTFDTIDTCVENPLLPPGTNESVANASSAMVVSFRCPQSGPPTPVAPSKGYICVTGNSTVAAQCVGTNVTGGGTSLHECENKCLDPDKTYICVDGACVLSVDPKRGVSKATCLELCVK